MPASRAKDLLLAEKREKRLLAAALLIALLSAKRSASLVDVPTLASFATAAILKLRSRAQSLALKHAESASPPKPAPGAYAAAQAAGAALASVLTQALIPSLAKGTSYAEAAEQAIKTAAPRVELTAQTELFKTYNKTISVQPGATFRWNSVLDKHTCEDCEELDGKEGKLDAFPRLPQLHRRCRCYLVII